MDIFSLKDKTILITGATHGIGKQIALRCSEAGANVIVTGRNKERLNEIYGLLPQDNTQKAECDITDVSAVSSMIGSLPKLDGVVLCAGLIHTAPIKHCGNETVNKVFQTNAIANIGIVYELIKQKKLSNNASVVFISSIASIKPYKGNALYSATKAAMESFFDVSAMEFSSKGIRFNSILPGIIEIDHDTVFSPEQLEQQGNKIPLGFGKRDDIAYGCIYLLSDASRWITGSKLVIDGGQSIS